MVQGWCVASDDVHVGVASRAACSRRLPSAHSWGPAKIGVFRAGIVSEERSWDIRLGISRPAKWMAVGTGWLEQIGRPEVVSLGGRTVAGRRPKARSPLPRRWRPGPTSARTLHLDAPGIHDRNAMLPLLVARRRGTDSCGFGGMMANNTRGTIDERRCRLLRRRSRTTDSNHSVPDKSLSELFSEANCGATLFTKRKWGGW